MNVIVLGGVMQHRVEMNFFDFRHRANIAGHGAFDFNMLLALQAK